MEKMFELFSPEDTFTLGEEMGRAAKPGQVYALYGDLGAGKTLFAQGFAHGLGITEAVASPTFTILQVYEEGRLPLYHMDVYRLGDPDELVDIGGEEYLFGQGVCLIEWADKVEELLPPETIRLTLKSDPTKGWTYRELWMKSASMK